MVFRTNEVTRQDSIDGFCWLCGHYGKLTREHIPPRAAFNNNSVLLLAVEEKTRETGRLEWSGKVEEGLIVRSLCSECNSRGGAKYGTHYIDFISRVAPIVERARDREQFILSGVRRPLSILKQIMQSFVSANGPNFVEANPWIRKFIRNSRNQEWSPELFAYIFATNTRGGRKSGLSAFFDFGRKRIRTVAEFTFWPLGMVLSFDSLDEYPVTPIHHWAQYDYSWPGQLDINLVVNPTSSAYALDFRTWAEMNRDAARIEPRPKVAGETLREVMRLAQTRGGGKTTDRWAFVTNQRPDIEDAP